MFTILFIIVSLGILLFLATYILAPTLVLILGDILLITTYFPRQTTNFVKSITENIWSYYVILIFIVIMTIICYIVALSFLKSISEPIFWISQLIICFIASYVAFNIFSEQSLGTKGQIRITNIDTVNFIVKYVIIAIGAFISIGVRFVILERIPSINIWKIFKNKKIRG